MKDSGLKFLLPLVICGLVLSLSSFLTTDRETIKVACIEDSITFGARLEDPTQDSYPAELQRLLGNTYAVENFGVSSLTLLKKGMPTVWDELPKVKASNPDILVISLGTNDTCGFGSCGDRKCWEYKDEFEQDLRDLIKEVNSWPSTPKIYLCTPSPMVLETPGLTEERISGLTERRPRLDQIIEWITSISQEMEIPLIDLNQAMDHQPDLFTESDGVHPNKKGYSLIASLIAEKILGTSDRTDSN